LQISDKFFVELSRLHLILHL